ncbi:MAG: hypothetical protein HQL20_05460 [Candidatus Omnitrophica bacterium]|nr:hypothetical protein [Candidatus Omnitrophota bacterium]
MVLLKRLFKSDWFIAAFILAVFLVTNRYIYGWDDQHLEITLLKHLIDPQLFQGDYYVESLKANFTSFLFPILARILKVEWIPGAYLFLYICARYFFFFFLFRLWEAITKSRWIAAVCTLGIFLIVRPEEFLYRTFSHQEFSYIFVFSGLWLFYRSRLLWAALVFGLGANIHALYCLFPMMYLGAYILFFHSERRWPLLAKCSLVFLAAALPFLVWTVARALTIRAGHPPGYYDNWMELYLLSCPQNFLFGTRSLAEATANLGTFFADTRNYFFVGVLYLFNWRFNEAFCKDLKVQAIALTTLILVVINFVFSYIWPSHFVLDLNLLRNQQYLLLFVGGYSLAFACREGLIGVWQAVFFGAFIFFLGGKELPDTAIILVFAAALEIWRRNTTFRFWLVAFILLAVGFFYAAGTLGYPPTRFSKLGWTAGFILVGSIVAFYVKSEDLKIVFRKGVIFSALLAAFIGYCWLHYNFVQATTKGGGFWQLQRNWEDMQYFVRDHTPKNAMILAPNDMEMGGFRIHSNRRVVVCYRDCGIVGFDYGATKEWQKRMADIEAFKVYIKEPFAQALINGITKYGADYIVFMKYAAPPENAILRKMYENEAFSLYQVMRK